MAQDSLTGERVILPLVIEVTKWPWWLEGLLSEGENWQTSGLPVNWPECHLTLRMIGSSTRLAAQCSEMAQPTTQNRGEMSSYSHAMLIGFSLAILMAPLPAGADHFVDTSHEVAIDQGDHVVEMDIEGYFGGLCNGRFLYFAPHFCFMEGEEEILRFDTSAHCQNVDSWSVFDLVSTSIGAVFEGRTTGVFEGHYAHVLPNNWIVRHAEVLRYYPLLDCIGNDIPDECEPPMPAISDWG